MKMKHRSKKCYRTGWVKPYYYMYRKFPTEISPVKEQWCNFFIVCRGEFCIELVRQADKIVS